MTSEIAEGISSVDVDTSVKKVEDIEGPNEFLKADAIILGTPTYASNISWSIKRLLDEILHQIYMRPEIETKNLSGFTSSETKIDGKRCLYWAFKHSKAIIIKTRS